MSMSFKASPDGTYGEILINGTSEGKIVAGATATDTTADRLLKVGDFGLGAAAPDLLVLDADAIVTSGFYATAIGSTNLPATAGILEVVVRASSRIVQKFYSAGGGTNDGRMWLRAKFDSTWTPWRLVFDQNTILGTVSQSSGIPTGAIIERGSNANGKYVRFADGTQICTHSATMTADSSRYTVLWTYPASFIAAADFGSVQANIETAAWSVVADRQKLGLHGGIGGGGSANRTFSLEEINGENITVGATVSNCQLCAVGRWY